MQPWKIMLRVSLRSSLKDIERLSYLLNSRERSINLFSGMLRRYGDAKTACAFGDCWRTDGWGIDPLFLKAKAHLNGQSRIIDDNGEDRALGCGHMKPMAFNP